MQPQRLVKRKVAAVVSIAPSDHALAQCVGSSNEMDKRYQEESVLELVQLVQSFAPPELSPAETDSWVRELTEYLINSDLDVYLGYLAPKTVQ